MCPVARDLGDFGGFVSGVFPTMTGLCNTALGRQLLPASLFQESVNVYLPAW